LKVKDAIAKILKMEGIEFATCFPNAPLIEACAQENIRPMLFRNENVAAQAADGFSRAKFGEQIGVLLVMNGPGIEVAFPGIRQAASDNVPVLVLAGAERSRRVTTDPYFDAATTFKPLIKWADTLYHADRTVEVMRRAFSYLRMGKPRPVLIAVPNDVANEEFPDDEFHYQPIKRVKPAGDPDQIREAVKMLLAAKNPVIRAGQGVLFAQAWDELRILAEFLQIPVITTLNGKSAFPENHPLYVGSGGRGHRGAVPHFYNKADLVFAIGSSCTTDMYIHSIPPGKKLIQLTIDEMDINKDYPVELAIIGDAKLVLRQLIEEAKKQTDNKGRPQNKELVREIEAVNEEWFKKWRPKLTSDEVPIHPYRVYWDMMKALDRNETIIVPDAGTPRDALTAFWEALIPGGFIGFGKDHMLGAGMGLAMGAKIARPEKTVVHIGGDGAFGEAGMDWETAVREKIAVINVVFNDGKMTSTAKVSPVASERFHVDELKGDYTKIAEAMGGYAERVEDPNEIIPAVKRAKKVTDSGMPALLEFMTRVEPEQPV